MAFVLLPHCARATWWGDDRVWECGSNVLSYAASSLSSPFTAFSFEWLSFLKVPLSMTRANYATLEHPCDHECTSVQKHYIASGRKSTHACCQTCYICNRSWNLTCALYLGLCTYTYVYTYCVWKNSAWLGTSIMIDTETPLSNDFG